MPHYFQKLCQKIFYRTLSLFLFGFTSLSLFLASALVAKETVHLTVQHFLPASSLTHKKLLKPWADALEKESNGRIKVTIYPSMMLGGKAPNLIDQVQEGVVDAAWTLQGYTPGRFPKTEVFELPFMPASATVTSQALQEFYETHLQQEYSAVKVIALHAHAPGTFHLRGRTVKTLSDLKGLKVRAPSRVTLSALEALGAVSVGMPVPQVPEALSRGVIDAALLPWEVAYTLKIHELADSHTEISGIPGFYTATFLFAMNRKVYEDLPDDLKSIIDRNSGLSLAKRAGLMWDEAELLGRNAAVKQGNPITILSGNDLNEWKDRTRPVVEEWAKRMDQEGQEGTKAIQEARRLIQKYIKLEAKH